jgi:integrase
MGLPRTDRKWTDDGESFAKGPLKHRATGTVRIVPAPPALMKILEEHVSKGRVSADGYLIRNRSGLLIGSGLNGPLTRAKERLGWEGDHPLAETTHYTLRHTCASSMLKAGLDIPEVAKRMGHSETELLKTYANVFHQGTAAANLKLDSVF